MKDPVKTFLKQSDEIEGVYSRKAHEIARMAWDYLIEQNALTPENILKCHSILMQGQLESQYCGVWRPIQVYVGYHTPPAPFSVPNMINAWIVAANAPKTEEDTKKDHIQFERIHPFVDGNGRMGRILMNWQRVKNGHDILILWARHRQDYYQWFKHFEI